jgi:anti-anti-sigma regulatory factor
MLRIHTRNAGNGTTMLVLEGRVIGPWVEELRQSCERVLAERRGFVLDLANVSFVGREGVELFRTLRDRQVVFRNCSPFVGEQLKGWPDVG